MKCITDIDVSNKRVLMRLDLNLPLDQGVIRDDTRLRAALPTIQYALEQNAAVMIMSHLGRPKEGEQNPEFSLRQIASALSDAVAADVVWLGDDFKGAVVLPGQCGLFENVRFLVGEKENDDNLGRLMANACDVYVMDAFATAHRAQASTVAVAKFAKEACVGLLVERELDYLTQALDQPKKPLLAIVGGAKVSGKIEVIESLIPKVDALIVGGGIANTFLAAQGHDVAASLYEPDWVERAKALLALAKEHQVALPLPIDVVVAERLETDAEPQICAVDAVPAGMAIFDVGPKSRALYAALVAEMNTIIWNGPLGVFEFPQFADGTHALAVSVAQSSALSIAGGGDTVAALSEFGLSDKISYISTAGGAFLEFLEGKPLPAISVLQQEDR